MRTVEEIREALSDRILTTVADKTGLHRETLYNIVNKRQQGMALETYRTLVKYLFGDDE